MTSDAFIEFDNIRIRIQSPDGSTDLATLTGTDTITEAKIESAIGQTIGSASARIADASLPVDKISTGNRAVFEVQSPRYAADWHTLGFTRVGDHSFEVGPTYITAELELHNYTFALLRDRLFTGRIRDEPVEDAIERVVNVATPELSVTARPEEKTEPTTTATYAAETALDVVGDLATEDTVISADGDTLVVDPMPSETTQTLGVSDLTQPRYDVSGEPVTKYRVEGGEFDIPEGDPQPDGNTCQSLLDDEGDARTFGVRVSPTRATQVSRLDITTRHDDISGTLQVRLHPADEEGLAHRPQDPSAAIAQRRLDATFVTRGGTTTIEFPDHQFKRDPWLVVTQNQAAGGGEAFEVAGRWQPGAGSAVFRPRVTDVRSPQPVVTEVEDEAAIDEYGLREDKISRDSIESFTEAVELGERRLAKNSTPRENLVASARSTAAHDLALVEAVDIEQPDLWTGTRPFVVTEKTHHINNGRLRTEFTFAQPAGF